MPSAHPVATSARGTDPRADVVVEEVEQTCIVLAEQMCVVLRLRWWKEDFMSMLNRNFARLLMMGAFSRVCSGLGVIRTLQGWSGSQGTELPILYKQSLQWWFRCMRLQACVGSVCVGCTALMCRGRECARLGSATRRVSFCASLDGGGLRPAGSSSESSGSVRVYIRALRTLYT